MKNHHANYAAVLGPRIKAHRERIGLTQNELGDRCGCDARTIRRIEQGKCNPKIFVLLDMSIAFGISLAELVRE